jgi:hypothetical protein
MRAPAVQRLQDLDALALAHRQAAHAGIGSTCRPKRCATALSLRARRGGAARERLPQRLGAHHHVVQHAQVVGQREVLVHHADARGQRGARVAGGRGWPSLDVPASAT